MGLPIGNLLNAAKSLLPEEDSGRMSPKKFLNAIKKFGIQVKCNYEVSFSGIADMPFFVVDISFPTVKVNYAELYYDGRLVEVPVNYDYDHDFSMTLLNDATGYIYTTFQSYLLQEAFNTNANSYQSITIKALTGDDKYGGMQIDLDNVKIESIEGLQFGHSDIDISTFTVNLKMMQHDAKPDSVKQNESLSKEIDKYVNAAEGVYSAVKKLPDTLKNIGNTASKGFKKATDIKGTF